MGPGLTWVGSIFSSSGWVRSAIYSLGLDMDLENFSKNINFFPSGQKVPRSKVGQPLIYCRSKVCLGRVGSGPISSLNIKIFLKPRKTKKI